jgi:hypothetical protein
MFNTLYKTIKRSFNAQSQTLTTYGASQMRIPFSPLPNAGWLRAVELTSPSATGATTLGGGSAAIGGGLQMAQWRELGEVSFDLQSTTNLWKLWNNYGGLEVGYLTFSRMGDVLQDRLPRVGTNSAGALSGTLFPFAFPDQQAGNTSSIVNIGPYYGFNTNPSRAMSVRLPFTEMIKWPNTLLAQSGNSVLISDSPVEMGLLLLENNQQNITPTFILNPVYGLSTAETPLIVTGAAVASFTSITYNMQIEAYDVEKDVNDWPTGKQLQYAIQRKSQEVAISSQACTCNFGPAGLLLRNTYYMLNDTTNRGTVYDMSATPAAKILLHAGSSSTLIDETVQINLSHISDDYGYPSPGFLQHNRIKKGSIVDALDTGLLTQLRTDFTGLPSVTTSRMRWIEERLIPVTQNTGR